MAHATYLAVIIIIINCTFPDKTIIFSLIIINNDGQVRDGWMDGFAVLSLLLQKRADVKIIRTYVTAYISYNPDIMHYLLLSLFQLACC